MESRPRSIPSKYFYDAVGSELFDEITRIPEYYLTRTETSILAEIAATLMEEVQPDELIELGAGSAEKTRMLLDAMLEHTNGRRYVPIDISMSALEDAVRSLCEDYADLAIDGLVADFDSHLHEVARKGRRLVCFLGSTIGNLVRSERIVLFREIAEMLGRGDGFLLGVDLVKDPTALIAAYDDQAGLTAAFTRNILTVVNRELGADFPVESFIHRPVWNASESRMEAWLEAPHPISVTIPDLEMSVDLAAGERIHTEVSCKFTETMVSEEFAEAGLMIENWYTDPRSWYALVLARHR
jgi:L-histidine N-alpha-methyltransferase